MAELEDAVRAANDSGSVADFVARLAERVGARAGVAGLFGDPVEKDGVTVIPVARAMWGFGGGIAPPGGGGDEGAGGGGGVIAAPAGYISIVDGRAEYRPIGAAVSPGALIAAAVAVYIALRGIRRLWS